MTKHITAGHLPPRSSEEFLGLDEKALKLLSYRYDEGTERDTFHARVQAKAGVDVSAVELLVPPTNLRAPAKPGTRRSVL